MLSRLDSRRSGWKRLFVTLLVLPMLGTGLNRSWGAVKPGSFVTQGDRKQRKIALTFDDGPAAATKQFLDLLDRYQVQGTFFVLADLAGRRAAIVHETAQRGHEVASHTCGHTNYLTHYKALVKKASARGQSEAQARVQAKKDLVKDMQRARAIIEKSAGTEVPLCRMPYGIDRSWVREAAGEAGFVLVNWTYGTDWKQGSVSDLLPGYLSAIRPGAILLFHDGRSDASRTLALAEAVIKKAKQDGYEIVTVSELVKAN